MTPKNRPYFKPNFFWPWFQIFFFNRHPIYNYSYIYTFCSLTFFDLRAFSVRKVMLFWQIGAFLHFFGHPRLPGSQAWHFSNQNFYKFLPHSVLGKVKNFQGRFSGEIFRDIAVLKLGGGDLKGPPPPDPWGLILFHMQCENLKLISKQLMSNFRPRRQYL